ncbi:MAG: pyridoxal phosphate-dependent aminotransferase [Blastocatellia bacterium]
MAGYSERALHGGGIWQAAQRWGVKPEDVLDFSANINPFGPPEGVRNALMNVRVIESYPDGTAFAAALAEKTKITTDQLVVGNGSAALIFAAIRAISPAKVMMFEPAFAEYHRAAFAVRADSHRYRLREDNGFLPDFAEVNSLISSGRIDLTIINSPHNPTGILWPHKQVLDIIRAAHKAASVVLLDNAFADFVREYEEPLQEMLVLGNTVVIKSLTKFYSIPGLRIGYAQAASPLASRIRDQIEAWSVSSLTLSAALGAITDSAYEQKTLKRNETARQSLAAALANAGVTVFPSVANFLLVKLPLGSGTGLATYLEPHRILVRQCGSFGGLGDQYIRVAVRSETDNERLAELIGQWLRQVSKGKPECPVLS